MIHNSSKGQSLIEILIALGIGALLVGAATVSIVFVVRSSSSTTKFEGANRLNRELLEKVRSVAASDWNDLYSLSKGTSTPYYVVASSSGFIIVGGKEGVIQEIFASSGVSTWGLDEVSGSVMYDVSGNNNYGVVIGDVVRTTSSCRLGYCITIPNEDYVRANIAGTPVLSSFSLTGWAKLITGQDGTLMSIRAGGDGSSVGVAMSGVPGARVINAGATRLTLDAPSSINLHDQSWHQLILTFDGVSRRGVFYVDGVVRASGTAASGITGATDYAIIGGDNDDVWGNWDGDIDEVRLYRRALSESEVYTLWNAGLFSRYFTIQNVCRDVSTNVITGEVPCIGGSQDDPSTQKITVTTEWAIRGETTRIAIYQYITRWKNRVFRQRDWSGGSGQSGPYTVPSSGFVSSSNLNASTSGVLRLQGF